MAFWVGAITAVAGVIESSESARSAEKSAKAANFFNLEVARKRTEQIDKLNNLADRLEQGEGISSAEKEFLNSVFKQATDDIRFARDETTGEVLDVLSGIGFLRSGRTAGAIRKISVEAGRGLAQAGLQRQQARLQFINQNRDRILQARAAILGSNVQIQPLDVVGASGIRGAGLQAIAGAFFEQSAEEQRTAALQKQIPSSRQTNLPPGGF